MEAVSAGTGAPPGDLDCAMSRPFRRPLAPRALPARAGLSLAVAALATLVACGSSPTPDAGAATPAAPASARASAESTAAGASAPLEGASPAVLVEPATGEIRIRDLRRLTSGGENAEAYWSFDGTKLVFQQRDSTRQCDQMSIMNADGSGHRVIASDGAHTCGFFLKGDERVVFASTRLAGSDCPEPPDRSQGYVWALHEAFDIFSARLDGSDVQRLTTSPGYDAEATVSPRDGSIVFTSVRDGDLDLYLMQPDGSGVIRLTDTPGYDGGAVFSPDGSLIVFRASRPAEGAELDEYRSLLAKGLVRPSRLELWVMNADGSGARQVTELGRANFAPTFTPDGTRLLFSSNHHDERGREFDLFLIGLDGTGLEQVTFSPEFDGFPLFSPDGRRLAFCSNRGNAQAGETNVFTAEWVD